MTTLLEACDDENLFQPWFRDRTTWEPWFAFLAALFAQPMSDEQLQIYRECTGRYRPPTEVQREAWLVVGRRGGKSFILALVATYLAAFFNYEKRLSPGERGTILILAAGIPQAHVIFDHVKALLTEVPLLNKMITRATRTRFDLSNRISIEVTAASFRTVRGFTLLAALCDELAFWAVSETSAEPDVEVLAALRPGMATIPNSMLLCASSPYGQRGALYDAHRKYFGKEGTPLLWRAPTRVMNPIVQQTLVDDAMAADPASAASEYLAEFRADLAAFVDREAISACTDTGVFERPPEPTLRYRAFTDPSGGKGDSFTLCIGHQVGSMVIVDALREVKPKFSPESVVNEFVALLKNYRVKTVSGDRYAGEWPREQFQKLGITYEVSEKVKSDLYQSFLPRLNSRQVTLLDNQRLITQLLSLERRTSRGGRDSIDHPVGLHDDVANSVAGLASLFTNAASSYAEALRNGAVGRPGDWKRGERLARNRSYIYGPGG